MNVLESRAGGPLHLRPWVFVVAAAAIVAAVLRHQRLVAAEALGLRQHQHLQRRVPVRLGWPVRIRPVPQGDEPRSRGAGRSVEHDDFGHVLRTGRR